MRDMGRAAMAAASLNAGVEMEAHAEIPPESGRLADTELYEHADPQTRKIMEKIDSGQYHVIQDATPAPVDCPADVLKAMAAQDLRLYGGNKILTTRDLSAGVSLDWGVVILDEDDEVVMETKSVEIRADRDAIVVTATNSDGSMDRHRFEGGRIVSAVHEKSNDPLAVLQDQEGYQNAKPDVQRIQEGVAAGEYIPNVDKTPAVPEVSEAVQVMMLQQGLHFNKKMTRIESNDPGVALSWEVAYFKPGAKEPVLETDAVNMRTEGKALVVEVHFSDGSMDRHRFENGRIKSKEHLQGG